MHVNFNYYNFEKIIIKYPRLSQNETNTFAIFNLSKALKLQNLSSLNIMRKINMSRESLFLKIHLYANFKTSLHFWNTETAIGNMEQLAKDMISNKREIFLGLV